MGVRVGEFFSSKTCMIGKTLTPCKIVGFRLFLFSIREHFSEGANPDFQNYNFKN